MGAGIVVFFWIFILAIISGILGAICLLIAWIFFHFKEPDERENILRMSFFTPAIFLYSLLFLTIVGDFVVTDKVSPSFGDEWWAPLNERYYLGAIDIPDSAYVYIHGEGNHADCDCRTVTNLWSTEDTVTLLCTNRGGLFSIYAFPVKAETFDTLSYLLSQEQIDSVLLERKLSKDESMSPDTFFCKAQQKAHRIEFPIRMSLVILLLVYLWVKTIRRAKRKKESQDECKEQLV